MSLIRVITRISPLDQVPESLSKLVSPGEFGSPCNIQTCCVTDPRNGSRYSMETTFFTESREASEDIDREISSECERFPGLVCATEGNPVLGDWSAQERCAALRIPESIPREEVPVLLNFAAAAEEREKCSLKIRFNLKKIEKLRRDSKQRHSEKRARAQLLRPLLRYFVDDECLICGFVLSSTLKEDIVHHMMSHIQSTSYKCECCRLAFTSVKVFYSHSIGHQKTRPHACTMCNKNFKRKHFLTVHHLKNHTESLSKPIYSRWDAFVLKQNIPPCFVCSVCRIRFSSFGSIVDHRKTHFGRESYQCLFCRKSFTSGCLMRYHSHIRIISQRYVCKFCDKSFISHRKFVEHKNSHLKKTLYTCDVCGKKFNFRKNLLKHAKIVHLKLIGVP